MAIATGTDAGPRRSRGAARICGWSRPRLRSGRRPVGLLAGDIALVGSRFGAPGGSGPALSPGSAGDQGGWSSWSASRRPPSSPRLHVGQQRDDPLSDRPNIGSWATLTGFRHRFSAGGRLRVRRSRTTGTRAPKDDSQVAGRRDGGAGDRSPDGRWSSTASGDDLSGPGSGLVRRHSG